MYRFPVWLSAICVGWCCVAARPAVADQATSCCVAPGDLRCEYLVNPLGIDQPRPRLAWKLLPLAEDERGQRQSAYRVLVASERSLLEQDQGDLWDTGRVESDQSIHVAYAGRPLASRMPCWWKVRVWDQENQPSRWSEPATWSMGMLQQADWSGAQWIGLDESDEQGVEITDIKSAQWLWFPEGNAAHDAPAETRYFRRDVEVPGDRKIARAICFFAGDDQCVCYLNGERLGVGHGHPNLVGADVTGQLRPGSNQLAVAATNMPADVPNNPGGWIGALRIEFESGPPLVVHSDRRWKCVTTVQEQWQTGEFAGPPWQDAGELGQAGIAPWGIPWKERWFSEHRRLAARYLRRELELGSGKSIRRATIYVCGLGFFDLHVNGQRIGDQLMNPALTGYDKRLLYNTFDVTRQLTTGRNALGVVLSNGRFFAPRSQDPMPMQTYGYPKLLLQLQVEFDDGTRRTIVTDPSWKLTAAGPIIASSEFDGEQYDARLEMPGWDAPGFDDSKWQSAHLVSAPGGQLEAQMIEPIRITEKLKPIRVTQPQPTVWMADFGQAFYGVVQLNARGPAGTCVTMRTSFNVLPNGTLNFLNDRSAKNTDVYTLKGAGPETAGPETWHPRFRGNATRWVQVEGYPGVLTEDCLAGLVTHTDHERVGEFSCSNELINRIFSNARWGTRMQNRSVPMEPDRDERMPWSGHPAKTSESEGWVYGVARFYDHFLHNYRVHQGEDGSLQEILPPYWLFNSKDVVWPSVATIIPDWYYSFYGDDRLLHDNFDMMKRFVLYHERANLKPDGTVDHCSYGDWVDTASIGANSRNQGATARPLVATAYFYHNCRLVERAAHVLGKRDDEQYFARLATRVWTGFNQRFFDPRTATYESGTQCSCVLPLAFGLVPDEQRAAVIDNLVEDIMVQRRGHTSVGLIGMQWQLQVLTDIGHPEVAYQIATRTDRPSWGYMISKGATTVWERWDTDTQDGGMNGESQKILSGNVEAWCFQTLGGINYDPRQPGFKHVILRPRPVGNLQWVRASHNSMYGKIASDWKIERETFEWRIVVPPNTVATVFVPTSQAASVRESGCLVAQAEGITLLREESEAVVLKVVPGTYIFSSPWSAR